MRRSFMSTLVMTGLALVSCGGERSPGSGARANVLRTNMKADPAMIDPITYSELLAGDVIGNMYESFALSMPMETWCRRSRRLGSRTRTTVDFAFT